MRLAVFLALLLSLNSYAAPFAVRVGNTPVALDTPPGFADTTFTGSPRLQELAETLTSASNRVLLFAVTDADLRRFSVGDQLEAKRYMVAVTPRAMERETVSAAAFSTFVDQSLRGLGAPPAAGADFRPFLDETPGVQRLLAELQRAPDAVSVLQGARLPSQGRSETPQYMLATTSLLLLRGKALSLIVHSVYESAADLDAIRLITANWIEALQRLNTR
jgi:hypothetical protein